MIVSIVGPDGSGKSSLAKGVVSETSNSTYLYLGYGADNRDYFFFSSFIKSKPRSLILRLIRRFLINFDDFYKLYKSNISKKITILDRYYYDNYVHSRVYNQKRAAIYLIICKLIPTPKLLVILVGDCVQIALRKNELSSVDVEKICEVYQDLAKMLKVKHLIVNTTDNSLLECTDEISKAIVRL